MKKTVSNVLKHLVCISLCIVVILPFYMVFINSLKPKAEAARMSLALPTEWHFETYLEVIEEANLVQGFFNSLTYAGISTTIGVLGCAMAAFVMARNKTKISNLRTVFPDQLCNISKSASDLQSGQYKAGNHYCIYQFHDPFLYFYNTELYFFDPGGVGRSCDHRWMWTVIVIF